MLPLATIATSVATKAAASVGTAAAGAAVDGIKVAAVIAEKYAKKS